MVTRTLGVVMRADRLAADKANGASKALKDLLETESKEKWIPTDDLVILNKALQITEKMIGQSRGLA